jgi:hypothetical protein
MASQNVCLAAARATVRVHILVHAHPIALAVTLALTIHCIYFPCPDPTGATSTGRCPCTASGALVYSFSLFCIRNAARVRSVTEASTFFDRGSGGNRDRGILRHSSFFFFCFLDIRFISLSLSLSLSPTPKISFCHCRRTTNGISDKTCTHIVVGIRKKKKKVPNFF